MITLDEIVLALQAAESLAPVGEKLAGLIGKVMVATEEAVGTAAGSGASKLNIVLAAAKAFAAEGGQDFAAIEANAKALIAGAKAAYNAIAAAATQSTAA